MAELISKLADAKIEVAEIQHLLMEKDTEIRELNRKLNVKENLQFERLFIFLLKKAREMALSVKHVMTIKKTN